MDKKRRDQDDLEDEGHLTAQPDEGADDVIEASSEDLEIEDIDIDDEDEDEDEDEE